MCGLLSLYELSVDENCVDYSVDMNYQWMRTVCGSKLSVDKNSVNQMSISGKGLSVYEEFQYDKC